MLPLSALVEASKARSPAALCTVVRTRGSTPRKVGAAMIVVDDGSEIGRLVHGTVGGGALEHEVRQKAIRAIASNQPILVDVKLTAELAMCCGGQVEVFVQPLQERPPCIVFGAGHVGRALCDSASAAGFDVTVVDPRSDLLTAEHLPRASSLVGDYEEADFEELPFGVGAFVVVVTHDHAVDQRLVEACLSRRFRYLAMIGSQRKSKLMRERCAAKGFDAELIEHIHSPAGLDIGAETPEEIAISIVSEMIRVRRQAD